MSIFDIRKRTERYHDEVKKQTDPYGYFCKNESIKRGEQRSESCPPFCIVTNLHDLIFGEDDFETEKKYIFVKTPDYSYEMDELSSEIMLNEASDIFYFDEDKITGGKRHTPFFKPEWSCDSFLFCNYIGSSFVISTKLAIAVVDNVREDWCNRELDEIKSSLGARDDIYESRAEAVIRYDFLLRATELTESITHISKCLAHRETETAIEEEIYTEFMLENQSNNYKRVRNEALARRKLDIEFDGLNEKNNIVINNNVIHNTVINDEEKVNKAGISIIIPSMNHYDILKKCIDGIVKCIDKSKLLDNVEIIVVDNGSSEEEKKKIEKYLNEVNSEIKTKYIYEPMDFNYSGMCNMGAKKAANELLLFLNDDIEPIMSDSFEKMAAYALMEHIGAVGVKLYYPEGSLIQHAGVVCDLDCGPTHKLATFNDENVYYYGKNVFNQNVLALTGACLMVNRSKYFKVGGFSDKMGIGYNDIDLCINLYENGFRNLLLNECVMFHHESLSRGDDYRNDAKYMRLKKERSILYDNHPWLLKEGDPFYSRNLISDTLEYKVNVIPEYERRASRSVQHHNTKLENMLINLCKTGENAKNQCRKLHFNIERTGFSRGIMLEEEDFYYIEGWSSLSGKDNSLLDTYLCLIGKEDCKIFDTFAKNREDVSIVFANEKNNCLSGFVCKISVSLLNKDEVYRLAIVKKSAITGRKYIVLGDCYESGRGYYTKEV